MIVLSLSNFYTTHFSTQTIMAYIELATMIRDTKEYIMTRYDFSLPMQELQGEKALADFKLKYKHSMCYATSDVLQSVLSKKRTIDEAKQYIYHIQCTIGMHTNNNQRDDVKKENTYKAVECGSGNVDMIT